MSRIRTDVEELFLMEMVQEDSDFILSEDALVDNIIPDNTIGIFDDTSSEDSELDRLINGDDLNLF